MHELSIARSLIEIVEEHVPADQLPNVRSVRVRVGALAGVVPESLSFCFEALVAETPLSAAQLELEHVPIRLRCDVCGKTFASETPAFRCPGCGGNSLRMESGTELELREVELCEAPAEVG